MDREGLKRCVRDGDGAAAEGNGLVHFSLDFTKISHRHNGPFHGSAWSQVRLCATSEEIMPSTGQEAQMK